MKNKQVIHLERCYLADDDEKPDRQVQIIMSPLFVVCAPFIGAASVVAWAQEKEKPRLMRAACLPTGLLGLGTIPIAIAVLPICLLLALVFLCKARIATQLTISNK